MNELKKLLLFSNSANAGEAYLEYTRDYVAAHLAGVKRVLFIPYAAVSFSYTEYEEKVQQGFLGLPFKIESIHRFDNPQNAVLNAEAIVVGGGNTFSLVHMLYQTKIMDIMRDKVNAGTPFVGWSAGANIACPTLRTTNDMPIVEPLHFETLNIIPFQINPHYLDAHPAGHAGETREQRINEFITYNKSVVVAGLREGSWFTLNNNKLSLGGTKSCRIFKYGEPFFEVNPGENIDFLMQNER